MSSGEWIVGLALEKLVQISQPGTNTPIASSDETKPAKNLIR